MAFQRLGRLLRGLARRIAALAGKASDPAQPPPQAAPEQSSPPAPAFHYFPFLPAELRHEIWRLCLPRRLVWFGTPSLLTSGMVACYPYPQDWQQGQDGPPAMASVCAESDRVARQHGALRYIERSPGQVPVCRWFDTRTDTLLLHTLNPEAHHPQPSDGDAPTSTDLPNGAVLLTHREVKALLLDEHLIYQVLRAPTPQWRDMSPWLANVKTPIDRLHVTDEFWINDPKRSSTQDDPLLLLRLPVIKGGPDYANRIHPHPHSYFLSHPLCRPQRDDGKETEEQRYWKMCCGREIRLGPPPSARLDHWGYFADARFWNHQDRLCGCGTTSESSMFPLKDGRLVTWGRGSEQGL